MTSPPSLSILFLLLILFAFSIPIQSQKTQLSRRNFFLIDQESQEQSTIRKHSTEKKKVALVEQNEEEQQISKSATKKKKLASEQEQEEKPPPKPTMKKKKLDSIEQEDQSIPKSTTKKKKSSPIDQEGDQSIPKSTAKKKKQESIEQEEEAIPEPTIKKKKLTPIEQGEDQADPKPTTKKKKISPIDQGQQDQPTFKSTTKNNKNSIFDSKNQTKLIKPKKSNSTSTQIPTLSNSTPKSKPNKTQTLKPSNATTRSPIKPKSKPINPIWLEEPDSDSDPDLIAEFRDLPARIHQALLPDLKKISITSKAYIYKANKNIAENMKPFVGNKFAPKIALAFSCIFLILPLCLVTFLFYHLNSYLSLQRFLIFVQAYLAIYFFTLSVTAVVTGLEPLRFFYATSPGSYAWTQAVQTLGYLMYLLVQLIHLVVVFSAGESKVGVRVLGLVQMIVGLAVGAHYYAAVFHRAVTGEPPRANWKVHGVYAGCFLVICLCARAERGKKAYDRGDDGKKS